MLCVHSDPLQKTNTHIYTLVYWISSLLNSFCQSQVHSQGFSHASVPAALYNGCLGVKPDLQFEKKNVQILQPRITRTCVFKIISELKKQPQKFLTRLATETLLVCSKQRFLLCHLMLIFCLSKCCNANKAHWIILQPVCEGQYNYKQ